ncbi:MAG: caspase family protein [Saccharofermentanales bacterium]
MKKLLLVALICLAVVLAIAPAAAVQPASIALGDQSRTAPPNLPVMQMPADQTAASSAVAFLDTVKPLAKKPPVPAANKWAVVIGIADYKGTGNDLWHPDEDANEMAKALVSNYGFASDHVKILLNRKATSSAIVAAIDWLVASEDSASTVVFFYSGHGSYVSDDDEWDSDLESDGYDEMIVSYDLFGLPDGYLRQKFAGLESHKTALLFGSCNSGGMFDDASDLQAADRVIVAACKADQYGWDYFALGNTLWAKYFVDEGLLQKLADLNGDGASIEEAFDYSRPIVVAAQPDSQPQMSDNYAGDFIP